MKKQFDPDHVYGGLIKRAKASLKEINQYLIDTRHWNTVIRPEKWPDQEPYPPDPDGEIEGWRSYLYKVLNTSVYYVACENLEECGYTGEAAVDDPCPRCGARLHPDQREPV